MHEFLGASFGALFATALVTWQIGSVIPIFLAAITLVAIARYYLVRFSMPGILWLTGAGLGSVMTSLWGTLFILEAGLPPLLMVLAFAALGLTLFAFLANLIASVAREAVLTHERWRLPVAIPSSDPAVAHLKVSLHLACYAEPPEIVIETMNRLAAQDYDNFEVLVCDNNTKDEALWRPLEAHCARLNAKLGKECFRFFHVDPLPGAKAGALNFLLEQTASDAQIIGVIDADYYSRNDFLSRLLPFFADPKLGYIQTPHDYRDYEGNDYLSACYWEYMPVNKVDYPGVSEYGGAFTIGTMCLMRKDALVKAGGWAEWCLTEDSEVSVRLRKVGYEGLYFGETFGRGLIPETFDDYKKQRFRWTAGPVQQLRRHWRLFLPAPFAAPLPGWTKLLEVVRCLAPLQTLAALVVSVGGMLAMVVGLAIGAMEPVKVPSIAGLLMLIGAATWWVRLVHRYRLSGCYDTGAMVWGEIARASLSYVVLVAGIAGLSNRPLAWRRTPKFAGLADESPFAATRPETIAGCASLAVAVLCLFAIGLLGTGVALLSFIGFVSLALRFFCAPLMAATAIRASRPAPRPSRPRYIPRDARVAVSRVWES
ncbi:MULTISPECIES: glycosyltransferase [unclassified Sphingobium]|uniref:glycosyltransferase n=1 Tax=unclassified Sphingobium TaxID=2611147 RepID=UPI0022248DAE|nr:MULTISPECIES: glycosyltransferase family 2 protein [unclassified Sphingobium]MCW2411261.1 cellulose synthase/poly-beta-1,6-N-acetylglucosamine synthase-like glycosyltransferase [Sphingobium sp. B8D3D]MCW2416447.1 cellulose synthase/poly-beta-1,6-N-acetylglucosamine synthase-like glycosyltransferase [Sphingobium sp. B8D3A]